MNRLATALLPTVLLALSSGVPLAAQDAWEPLATGTTQDLYAVHFVSDDVGYVAGAEGVVLKTTDGGATWADVSLAPDLRRDLFGLYFFDADVGVAVGRLGRIARTTNGGTTWTAVPSGTEESLSGVAFAGSTGLIGGSSQTILRSEDEGVTWSVVQADSSGGGFLGVDMVNDAVGFVVGGDSVAQALVGATTDGGATFDFTAFSLDGTEGYLEDVRFLDELTGVAVGATFDFQGAVARSEDGGQTWTTALFPDALNAVDFATAETGYAVGVAGALLKTTDGGQTWAPEESGTAEILHGISIPTLATAYAAGSAGTVVKGVISTGTPVAGGPPSSDFVLEPNAPNPFRARTAIRYSLRHATQVTLRVYDALGQEVAVLADGYRAPGRHEVTFDAAGLSAGVYRCVLEAGAFTSSRPMLLLK